MKVLFFVFTVLGLWLAEPFMLYATEGACGGVIVSENDCYGNKRKYHLSCCPEGYRMLGAAYTDIKDQDHADAVSAICLSPTNESALISDFARKPKEFSCGYNERMVGIESKDVLTESNNTRDSLDGLTVFCQRPGDEATRKVVNKDLEGGREGRELIIPKERQIIGLAYKELDKGSSDRADCVTLITK